MLKYWLWLTTRKGLGPRGALLVLRHFSSPKAAYAAGRLEYSAIPGLRSTETLLDKDLRLPEQILKNCYEKRISVLTIQDAAYPERLKNISDPPLVLYWRGTLPDLNGLVVSVVGTRRASAYGLLQAERMGYSLSRSGCMVASGLAKGVDTQAMQGALLGGAPVIGVVAGGLDLVYPAENRKMYEDVAQHGCLLSEYPPGTPYQRSNFPQRNRILSGVSAGVVVVESPEKSGALITASKALEQGRDVFALPANVGVETAAGNLKLLREGAILACGAEDVLQEYAALYPLLRVEQNREEPLPKPVPKKPETPRQEPVKTPEPKKVVDKPENRHYIDLKGCWDALSADERALAQLLRQGPRHMDDLTEETKLPSARILASLTLMEVKGLVRRPAARWYALAEAEEM